MVKLDKIYTRGGDGGETSLGDGSRVPKHSQRVGAQGDIDETNATIGLARRFHLPATRWQTPTQSSPAFRTICLILEQTSPALATTILTAACGYSPARLHGLKARSTGSMRTSNRSSLSYCAAAPIYRPPFISPARSAAVLNGGWRHWVRMSR